MSGPSGSTGLDLSKEPHQSILKRIDIGLMTGLVALLLSFVGIMTSRATFKMNQETQKARVMPIIDIDLGYDTSGAPLTFSVKLDNVGVGLADIRSVEAFVNGEPGNESTFQSAVMSPRMTEWAEVINGEAVNYLRAGDSVVTHSNVIKNPFQARANEYFSGKLGVPLSGADIKVCYCSVFEDCWTVSFVDRKPPEPTKSCGINGAPKDVFEEWRETRNTASADQDN